MAILQFYCQNFEFIDKFYTFEFKPVNAKDLDSNFKKLAIRILKPIKVLDKKSLIASLKLEYPNIPDATINWRLHQLKEQKVIQSMGYGKYTLSELKSYIPVLSARIKRIHNSILKQLPYTSFCVWEGKWFNEFMLHQLFRNYLVVEVEKESVESVFNILSESSKRVYLNPTAEIYLRYIANDDEAIIVKTMVSESPIIKSNNFWVATIEKILVDCLIDKDLYAAQQNELDFIFKSVFSKYTLSISKMNRYARRRGYEEELKKFIHKYLEKK